MEMDSTNYIIAEIYIKDEDINKNIRIINSFENVKKEHFFIKKDYKFRNEKQIKKCKISINNIIIPFCYYHKFDQKGKYTIKYLFSNKITNCNYLFYECDSLTNIDLSNFNTQNITDMHSMFHGCNSLTNINLSNINTQNVNNISWIFYNCSSLTSIDLSNFNTQNVNNMSHMFFGCTSLTNIDLSNFYLTKVKNMSYMFCDCNSLTNIDLSYLNT